MNEALVQVRSVDKSYQRGKQTVEVLHRLTLDVPRGDFVALMGPSGSGKTTLLNLIGGLDRPTAGEILVEGLRIDQLSGSRLAKWRARNVGFVFQFYNLMPVLTAERNVELPLLLTDLSAAQRRKSVNVALQVVGAGRARCGRRLRPRARRRRRRPARPAGTVPRRLGAHLPPHRRPHPAVRDRGHGRALPRQADGRPGPAGDVGP
jgi:predicted ABC-type transport system involved in lysophospholipase L1 biosynthesis ATPase subunit